MTRLAPSSARRVLITTSTAVALVFLVSATDAGERGSQPPNMVIILVDDLGQDDIGRNVVPDSPMRFGRIPFERRQIEDRFERPRLGNTDGLAFGTRGFQHTPHIALLFEQGIVLRQYLTHTLCSPSRAGLLTGRHYTRVGSGPRTGGTLHLDVANIARDLQSNGYATAAFGKWHNSYPNFPAEGNGVVVTGCNNTDPRNEQFENCKGIPWGAGVNAYGFDEWQGFYGGGADYFDRMSGWHNDIDWWTDRSYTPGVTGHTPLPMSRCRCCAPTSKTWHPGSSVHGRGCAG